MFRSQQKRIFAALLCICLCGWSMAAEEAIANEGSRPGSTPNAKGTTYGELLLIEKQMEPVRDWQLEVSGMQEFSNPYLDVNGVSGAFKKSIGPFVFLGPEFTRYFTEESEVSKTVAQNLKTDTIRQSISVPISSYFGVASIVPISGQLNWFNRSSLPFELELTIGYGSVQYKKESGAGKRNEGAVLWRIGPRAFITQTIGLQLQFGQEVESPLANARVTRSHARVGVLARF